MGQLDQEGYCTTLTESEWKITNGAMAIALGKKNDILYVTSSMENIVAVVESNERSKI